MHRGMRRSFILMIAFGAALFITAAHPNTALAQSARLSVKVILASNSGGGMDGSLGSIASQLRSRFGQYSDFRLMGSHSVSLANGGSQNIGLPNGQSMRIGFMGMSGSSYRLQVSLPGGGTTVTAQPGGIFFVAGPRYQSGILIIAITP